MGINFANNATLSQVGSYISAPGRIVQTVQTNYTTLMATSSTSAVDFFTSSGITLTNASNRILIEWHSDNRCNDWVTVFGIYTTCNWSMSTLVRFLATPVTAEKTHTQLDTIINQPHTRPDQWVRTLTNFKAGVIQLFKPTLAAEPQAAMLLHI